MPAGNCVISFINEDAEGERGAARSAVEPEDAGLHRPSRSPPCRQSSAAPRGQPASGPRRRRDGPTRRAGPAGPCFNLKVSKPRASPFGLDLPTGHLAGISRRRRWSGLPKTTQQACVPRTPPLARVVRPHATAPRPAPCQGRLQRGTWSNAHHVQTPPRRSGMDRGAGRGWNSQSVVGVNSFW